MRILSVGNSFSTDALSLLPGMLDDCGKNDYVIGCLTLGACSLETHMKNAQQDRHVYTYQKSRRAKRTLKPYKSRVSLSEALCDEKWDYISLQQSSEFAGQAGSFEPYLTELIGYIRSGCRNAEVKLVWHMTWALSDGYGGKVFSPYGFSSERMYSALVEAVISVVLDSGCFDMVVPVATAVQNARTGILKSSLSRDGRHLSLSTGRALAAMTWAEALGCDIDRIDLPSLQGEYRDEAIRSVKAACKAPYTLTPAGSSSVGERRYTHFKQVCDVAFSVIQRFI